MICLRQVQIAKLLIFKLAQPIEGQLMHSICFFIQICFSILSSQFRKLFASELQVFYCTLYTIQVWYNQLF